MANISKNNRIVEDGQIVPDYSFGLSDKEYRELNEFCWKQLHGESESIGVDDTMISFVSDGIRIVNICCDSTARFCYHSLKESVKEYGYENVRKFVDEWKSRRTVNKVKMTDDMLITLLYPGSNKPVAHAELWFYELLFYKKCRYTVVTDKCYGEEEILYGYYPRSDSDTSIINRFRCGTQRKLDLLYRYGTIVADICFINGRHYYLPVGEILTVFGWKTIMCQVDYILNTETGEVLFHTEI